MEGFTAGRGGRLSGRLLSTPDAPDQKLTNYLIAGVSFLGVVESSCKFAFRVRFIKESVYLFLHPHYHFAVIVHDICPFAMCVGGNCKRRRRPVLTFRVLPRMTW
jgi:hypothetical protein